MKQGDPRRRLPESPAADLSQIRSVLRVEQVVAHPTFNEKPGSFVKVTEEDNPAENRNHFFYCENWKWRIVLGVPTDL